MTSRIALCIAILATGGSVAAQMLAPSDDQLAAFRSGDPNAPVGLVQHLRVRDREALARTLEVSEAALRAAGGRRAYVGDLDKAAPGALLLRFDVLVIDEFPSRRACLEALDAENPHREAALEQLHVIAVRPVSRLARAGIRVTSALFWFFGGKTVTEAPPVPVGLERDPELGLSDELARVFLEADQSASLMVVNLNKSREKAQYTEGIAEDPDVSGAEAYARYGRNTLPQLFRRGGRPVWMGTPEQVLVGAPDDPLSDTWDGFALVYYPSRLAMRDMLNAPEYQRGFHHRAAGLERAVVIPGTPWPEFDPKR